MIFVWKSWYIICIIACSIEENRFDLLPKKIISKVGIFHQYKYFQNNTRVVKSRQLFQRHVTWLINILELILKGNFYQSRSKDRIKVCVIITEKRNFKPYLIVNRIFNLIFSNHKLVLSCSLLKLNLLGLRLVGAEIQSVLNLGDLR